MILVLYATGFVLILALVAGLGLLLARRPGATWRLWAIGAATFVASQVLHVPFNLLVIQGLKLVPTDVSVLPNLIILAVFTGLSAGVFEELARYVSFRYWARDARSWAKGLMIGAGHGGIEAVLVVVLGAANVGLMAAMRQGAFLDAIPAEQLPLVEAQIAAVFEVPIHLTVFPALERLFAICAHLALSLMVMQVFTRGKLRWLVVAILWHAALNASAVFTVSRWGVVAAESIVGIFALVSVWLVYRLHEPEPATEVPEAIGPAGPAASDLPERPVAITPEMLDRSKFSE